MQPGEWVLGRGWDQNRWPAHEWPAAGPLDVAAPQNPVFLTRIDGHAALFDVADADRQRQNCGICAIPVTEFVRQSAIATAAHLDGGRADGQREAFTPRLAQRVGVLGR